MRTIMQVFLLLLPTLGWCGSEAAFMDYGDERPNTNPDADIEAVSMMAVHDRWNT